MTSSNEADSWGYIWGSKNYSSQKAYKHLTGSVAVHPVFMWIWCSSCQMKHKVFFWLLIKNRLNTRGLHQKKNMVLESYVCELCIHQSEEKLRHLFFKCPFARNCWQAIGINVPTWLKVDMATRHIKRSLHKHFAMEVIILICWSIWIQRNGWPFQNRDPSVKSCISSLKSELVMVIVGLIRAGPLIFNHGFQI
jgi:hypothetical protein